jgi:16S rRNA (cytosine967-C5)-methyltransferase
MDEGFTPSELRPREVPWEALAGLGPALDAPLRDVLGGAPAERVLDRLLRGLPALSRGARAAVAEAVFGVGLWRRRLRRQLGDGAAPPRLLLAALVRELGGRADAAALLALDAGALPAPRPPPPALADRYSLPDWLAAELVRAAGHQAAALADALNGPAPICLRVNGARTTRAALVARLAAEGIAAAPAALAPEGLVVSAGVGRRPNLYGTAAWRAGEFEVQDEASQLAGALAATPGGAVLDACAGAGGKTLLLAAHAGAAGRVHACDLDQVRLERLRARVARAGVADRVLVHGAAPPPGLAVDAALVDAPCSELGTLRRGPDLRWRLEPAAFAHLPALQLELLAGAARCVRPGGRLVYATCTFREEEDEAVARAFERAHPGFHRLRPAAPGAVHTPEGFLRTWPHRHGADAFFAAAWQRGDLGGREAASP